MRDEHRAGPRFEGPIQQPDDVVFRVYSALAETPTG